MEIIEIYTKKKQKHQEEEPTPLDHGHEPVWSPETLQLTGARSLPTEHPVPSDPPFQHNHTHS